MNDPSQPQHIYGVFPVGLNVFGERRPVKTFPNIDEAWAWKDAQPIEPGRDWVVRALTSAEIDAWVAGAPEPDLDIIDTAQQGAS